MAADSASAQRVFASNSSDATEALGAALGERLAPGALVALDGELGAGKTTFVRGLVRGLGSSDPVTSPTFALMHEYRGRYGIFHFDAWRTNRERALLEEGAVEWLSGPDVALVEWAERVAELLPISRIEVVLEHRGPRERRITMRAIAGAQLELAVRDVPARGQDWEEVSVEKSEARSFYRAREAQGPSA